MTSRDRRALAVGAAVILLGLGLTRGIPVVARWYQATSERVALSRTLIARQEAELALLPRLEARGDSLRQTMLALAGRLIAGTSEAEAQAELLGGIEAVFHRSKGRLDQLDPLADSVGFGRLRRVQARATLTADLAGILDLIKQVEWGAQLMLVRSLRIEVAGELGSLAAETLRAEFVVEGWFLRREATGE